MIEEEIEETFEEILNNFYEKETNWKKEQLADILVYYSMNWLIKFKDDMIYIYDDKFNLVDTYENYKQFKKEIYGE